MENPEPLQVKFDPLARLHRIEDYARNAPRSAETRIPKLAAYLTRYCRSDEQKALAIYAWITSHIEYDDYGAEHDEALTGQDADSVLALRKGVCAGYSKLFVALCQASGVKAEYVTGYVKSWDKIIVDEDDLHAWNAVYWNQRWHLVDSTWGEDYLQEARTYPPQYFDVDPEKMLASHFPDNPTWQLRDRRSMTRQEFNRQCLREPEFFELGMELMDTTAYEMAFDRECTLRLKAPPHIYLDATLESEGKKLDRGCRLISRRGNIRAIEIRPPIAGRYSVHIWADGNHVLTYHLKTRLPQLTRPAYPEQWDDYQSREVLIHEPLEGVIKKQGQHFHLNVPQARRVWLHSGESEFPLRKNGDDFEGDFSPAGETVEVSVELEGVTLFGPTRKTLLTYQVR